MINQKLEKGSLSKKDFPDGYWVHGFYWSFVTLLNPIWLIIGGFLMDIKESLYLLIFYLLITHIVRYISSDKAHYRLFVSKYLITAIVEFIMIFNFFY